MMTPIDSEIYEFLRTIPAGKVVTYGQIADHFGNKNLARHVGNMLHKNHDGDKYPCYKIVNCQGKLSANYAVGRIDAQRKLLELDGIVVENYTVNLEKYQW